MNVIQYLIDDENNIEDRLKKLTENYFQWPRNRCFEESKKILNAIGIHLRQKESLLTDNLKSKTGLENVLKKSIDENSAIDNEIDNLTQLHVDEPGFNDGLKSLLAKITDHNNFCEQEFYPQLKTHLSTDDFKHIEQQLNQMVLS